MGIGSWWKKMRRREDEALIEREVEREHETPEEQRFTSGDMTGLESDERAARSVRDANIEDVERFAEGDDR
jgi:hypothetical protein